MLFGMSMIIWLKSMLHLTFILIMLCLILSILIDHSLISFSILGLSILPLGLLLLSISISIFCMFKKLSGISIFIWYWIKIKMHWLKQHHRRIFIHHRWNRSIIIYSSMLRRIRWISIACNGRIIWGLWSSMLSLHYLLLSCRLLVTSIWCSGGSMSK